MGNRNISPASPAANAAALSGLPTEQAYMLAEQYFSKGRLREAEALLAQILGRQPRHAFALHLLGLIAHQAGKPEQAIELVGMAIEANGRVALFHANLCGIYRQAGRLGEAIMHGERAVALDPKLAMAYANLGLACHDNGDLDKDEACQRQLLKLHPGSPVALYNLGCIMRERKQMEEAADYYRRAIAAQPDYLEALNDLGGVLLEMRRHEEAIEVLARALKLAPQCAQALRNQGCALIALERFAEAQRFLARALSLEPENAEALITIAKAYRGQQKLTEAERAAVQALGLAGDKQADIFSLLGGIYTEMGETAKAAQHFDRALELDPELPEALVGKGNHLVEIGEFEKAEELLKRALALADAKLPALFALSHVKKIKAGDERMAALLEITDQADTLPEESLITLHFALGKCYDDIGDAEQAFRHFEQGGHIKRKRMNYDADALSREFTSIIETFDQNTLARLAVGGIASDLPIFVLGMPRSGTTLTEQIVASHPDVHGAGELNDIVQISRRMTPSGSYPDNLKGLTPELVSSWAQDYLAGLQTRAPEARRITDKMPGNFQMLGLIRAMLPQARIIHVRRNPVDNCLSCFTKLFGRGHAYSYDLAELGRYYTDYARLMDHWREALPEGAFLEVRYEDLVADTEAQARRLIEYCGLEWNEACLEFHKTKRSVRTASVAQVRQPIYKSSVERWRRYEPYLKPLLDELGDLAGPAADRSA